MIIRFELSTEFTRWKQRLDPRNAASTGMKPEESLAPHGILVAANYRPTGMKPVVAKHREKCFTALPREGDLFGKTLAQDLDDLQGPASKGTGIKLGQSADLFSQLLAVLIDLLASSIDTA